jgi:hypothetical protein
MITAVTSTNSTWCSSCVNNYKNANSTNPEVTTEKVYVVRMYTDAETGSTNGITVILQSVKPRCRQWTHLRNAVTISSSENFCNPQRTEFYLPWKAATQAVLKAFCAKRERKRYFGTLRDFRCIMVKQTSTKTTALLLSTDIKSYVLQIFNDVTY